MKAGYDILLPDPPALYDLALQASAFKASFPALVDLADASDHLTLLFTFTFFPHFPSSYSGSDAYYKSIPPLFDPLHALKGGSWSIFCPFWPFQTKSGKGVSRDQPDPRSNIPIFPG